MRTFIFIIASLACALAPVSFSAASGTERVFRYEDPRLGEKKDESDRFKFARVKLAPMFMGGYLGDRGEPWSHDYPEAGLHFSKILSELSKHQVVLYEDEYIYAIDDPNLKKYPYAKI
jgi:hypothetical protein